MNVCIPVMDDRGLDSRVSPHFGSAPRFLIVETATRASRPVVNTNAHHEHGRCQPLAVLAGEAVDAFVVGGIGAGALSRLLASGIRVYRAIPGTAGDVVDAMVGGRLDEMSPAHTCRGHAH